jgi:hypothetical protein
MPSEARQDFNRANSAKPAWPAAIALRFREEDRTLFAKTAELPLGRTGPFDFAQGRLRPVPTRVLAAARVLLSYFRLSPEDFSWLILFW